MNMERDVVYTINDSDIIEVQLDSETNIELTGAKLKELAPDWNGEFAAGDIITTDKGKQRILSLVIKFPDHPNTITKYKITVGNL